MTLPTHTAYHLTELRGYLIDILVYGYPDRSVCH